MTIKRAAASSAASGTEHWIAESTNPVSATATLIARGPLTIGGTITSRPATSHCRAGR